MALSLFAYRKGNSVLHKIPSIAKLSFLFVLCIFTYSGGIGFVYGLLTWGFTVPPRLLFWTGSLFGLFEMRLGAAIGNGITFFNSTIAIIVLSELF